MLTQRSGASQRISGFLLKGICLQIIVDLLYLYGEGGSRAFYSDILLMSPFSTTPPPKMKVLEEMILVVPSSYRRLWKSKDMVLLPSHNLPHKPNYVSPSFLLP